VNGKCGFVKGEKPVCPNWLNPIHHAPKKEGGTEEVILGIDFP